MGTQSFPARRHSGHRWWALRPAQTGSCPWPELGEARFCAHAWAGCLPAAFPWPLLRCLCHDSHRLGAVLSCWPCSGLQQASPGWGARPGGASWHSHKIKTRWRQEGHIQLQATFLEARTPRRLDSCSPCPRGAGWLLSQGHKVSEPKRASAATPWTTDKRSQGGGLCPRSGGSEAPHLLPWRCSFGHGFGCMAMSPSDRIRLERAGRSKEPGIEGFQLAPAWDAEVSLCVGHWGRALRPAPPGGWGGPHGGASWWGLPSPQAFLEAGPWITQQPHEAHQMQICLQPASAVRKSSAPLTRKSLALGTDGFRGICLCQPVSPAFRAWVSLLSGLSSPRGGKEHASSHLLLHKSLD